MPSFVHKTLLRASHVMSVIEGEWVPSGGHKQYLLHYGTSFEIVEFDEVSASLTSLFWQPLFAKVTFVCDGPCFGKYSSFLAFRRSDILVLCYSEAHQFFTAKKQLFLPDTCFSASFGFYYDNFVVASAPSGGLCSIDMRDGSTSALDERLSPVTRCFRYRTSQIVRLEKGGRISIYQCPGLTLAFREIYTELKYAFPFGYNGYVLWNRDDMLVHIRGQSVYKELPVDDMLNSPIDDAFLTYNNTLLLTREGNIMLFSEDDVSTVCKYEHAYGVFRLSSCQVLVCRSGMDHIVLSVAPSKVQAVTSRGYHSISRIVSARVLNRRFEIISKSSVCFIERGVVKHDSGRARTEGDVQSVSAFQYGEHECVALTFGAQTSFGHIENGQIVSMERSIRLDDDKRTVAVLHLLPDILVQVHELGLILIRRDDVRVHDVERPVVKYTATPGQLVLFLKRGSPRYLLVDKQTSRTMLVKLGLGNGGRHTKVRCGVFVPEDVEGPSKVLVFCDQTLALQVAEIDMTSISDGCIRCTCQAISRLERYPTDLQFAAPMRLCIGFDDGTVVIANYDKQSQIIRNDLVFRLGLESIAFSSGLVIASRLHVIKESGGVVDMCPIVGTAKVRCCASLSSNAMVAGGENSLAVFSIGPLDEEDSFEYVKLPVNFSFVDIVRIAETSNYVLATSNLVQIYDIDDGEAEELVEFDTGETFASMLLTEKRLVIASWCERGSEIRVFKIGENNMVLSPPMQFFVNGNVAAIAEFHNGLLFGFGNTVLFYLESDNRMQIISKTDGIGKDIKRIITHGSSVYVGDGDMAVLALEYVTERQQFLVSAQDTYVRNITCMCNYGNTAAVGDADGSVVLYGLPRNMVHDLSRMSTSFLAKKAIPVRLSYHIGEVISTVTCVGGQGFYMSLLYSTSLGTLGCFLENTSQQYSDHLAFEAALKRLKKLELEMASLFEELTKSDFIQFRNETLPCTEVVDLDIINFYFRLSDSERVRIASALSNGFTPTMVDQIITTANSCFRYLY